MGGDEGERMGRGKVCRYKGRDSAIVHVCV